MLCIGGAQVGGPQRHDAEERGGKGKGEWEGEGEGRAVEMGR